MSLVTRQARISVKKFAAVPPLLNLPEIQRPPATASQMSSFRGPGGGVDLAEGCILTKSVKYTHQIAHFVNAIRHGDPSVVEDLVNDLHIVPYQGFSLDHPCNLAYLEAFVHTSMDIYAFIAVTASSSTLSDLLEMVKSENQRQQRQMDERGFITARSLNFTSMSFVSPEYELVALHPEHFLPGGSKLTVYDSSSANATCKDYVPAGDRYLRESVDSNSPRLPPFRHKAELRNQDTHLNVFLVILNAEIKFHRYLEMIRTNPPTHPLPVNVINLMHRTIELVDLLYWKPVPARGSKGEQEVSAMLATRRRNYGRAARSAPEKIIERGSSEERETAEEEMEMGMDEDAPSNAWASSRHRKFHWPADMDLEARRAYGRALMSGSDLDYDPALFQNAIPVNYTPDMYSERTALEAWNRSVSSDN